MNSVILTGRLTRTPEAREKQDKSGLYCFFTIAVDEGKDKSGQKITSFIECVAYDKQASFLSTYLKKGYLIAVNGSLSVSDKDDGQGNKVRRWLVKAWSVENLQPRETQQQPTAQAPAQAPAPQPAQPIAQDVSPEPTEPAELGALPFEI